MANSGFRNLAGFLEEQSANFPMDGIKYATLVDKYGRGTCIGCLDNGVLDLELTPEEYIIPSDTRLFLLGEEQIAMPIYNNEWREENQPGDLLGEKPHIMRW